MDDEFGGIFDAPVEADGSIDFKIGIIANVADETAQSGLLALVCWRAEEEAGCVVKAG